MEMDPRLQPLADVLVKVLVREILDEKSHRCGEMQNGGLRDTDEKSTTQVTATSNQR